MKDYATYETAVLLKEAGFPQPQPEAGQVWYANYMNIWASVVHVGGRSVNHVNQGYMLVYSTPIREFKTACIFAPTATDILQEIGRNRLWKMSETPVGFGEVMKIIIDPEAAALAWLELNEKQAENE